MSTDRVAVIQRVLHKADGGRTRLRFGKIEIDARHGDLVAYGYEPTGDRLKSERLFIDVNGVRHYEPQEKRNPTR
jgi:hypothetical protein